MTVKDHDSDINLKSTVVALVYINQLMDLALHDLSNYYKENNHH